MLMQQLLLLLPVVVTITAGNASRTSIFGSGVGAVVVVNRLTLTHGYSKQQPVGAFAFFFLVLLLH